MMRSVGGEKPRKIGWPADMLVLLFVALALRLPAIGLSELDWDETSFVLVAREILHGHWPYTTIFDHKPIGLYLHFAAALALFGERVIAARLLGIAVVAAAAICVRFACIHRLGLSRASGMLFASSYILATVGFDGEAVYSEHLVNLYLLVSALLLPDRRRGRIALSGFAAGIAVSINYLAIPVIAGLVAGHLIGLRASKRAERLGRAGLFVAGALVSTVLTLLPVLLFSDLADYFTLQLRFLSGYSAHRPLALRLAELARTAAPLLPILAASAALLWLRRSQARSEQRDAYYPWPFAGMGAGSAVAALASGYLYPHYLLLAIPAVVLLAASLAGHSTRDARAVISAVVAATALTVAMPGLIVAAVGARILVAKAAHGREDDLPRQLAARAAPRAPRASTIYSFCAPLVLYELLHAEPATKFPFTMQSMNQQYASALGISVDGEIRSVFARRPVVVVMGDYSQCWGIPQSSWLEMRGALQRNRYTAFARYGRYSFFAPPAPEPTAVTR